MTFPPTDTPRRFSIIPQPPADASQKQAEFDRVFPPAEEPVPELLHHFDMPEGFEPIPPEGMTLPVEHPAYSAFPGGVIPDMRSRVVTEPIEPEPTARERFEQRQAERQARRNAQGFDWGVDDEAPRERQWRVLDLSIFITIMGLLIANMTVIFTSPLALWTVAMTMNAICVFVVAALAWTRYDIGAQARDLLIELRLLREEV
jgi:hypothetical protein